MGRRSPAVAKTRRRGRWLRAGLWLATGFALGYLGLAYAVLDYRVRAEFGQTQWRVPARVYTQPLDLYAGRQLDPAVLRDHLSEVGYRRRGELDEVGEFVQQGSRFRIRTRAFRAADGSEPARRIRVRFNGGRVAEVTDADGEAVIARIEPQRVASVFPGRAADRRLLRLDSVPERLVETIIAVEDQQYFDHFGVQPSAILRAAWANLQAGRIVQGGSTITQQLAKNFYLSGTQTLGRKFNEALMALSLELHYSKEAILEAYINEVYLGQDGSRSIHGFGLGAQYWFNRPLEELDLHQTALLVGLIRGPIYLDPRENPARARQRRNVVLQQMAEQGVVAAGRAQRARNEPLDVASRAAVRLNGYPAYADLVRRQLARDYDEEDLRSEGLRVYTHLDPRAQAAAEQAVSDQVERLGDGDALQGAAVIAEAHSGAVTALVGGRSPRTPGFNRALDARRQIGSLVKPAVYLAALRRPEEYTLATLVADRPVTIERSAGPAWEPRNYDGEFRGELPLIDALAQSRNAATVRVGMDVGLDAVRQQLAALTGSDVQRLRPSALLGAIDSSPFQVAAMYQTLATQGFHAQLSAIAAVHDGNGESLTRAGLDGEQVVAAAPVFLVNEALRESVRRGTAGSLGEMWRQRGVAGKTGTTNGFRDSWFAGFDSRHVGVAWVGRDDNQPTGLSGSAGGMRVWADMMEDLPVAPQTGRGPAGVDWARLDIERGVTLPADCDGGRQLPFLTGSKPPAADQCNPTGWDHRGLP